MGRNESVVRYFNRNRALVWELEALGADVGDEELVTALLVGLQGKYDLVATVLAVQPGITVEMAQEQLQATEPRLGLTKGADAGSALKAADKARPRANKRGGRRDMADVRCYQRSGPKTVVKSTSAFGCFGTNRYSANSPAALSGLLISRKGAKIICSPG